MSNIGNLEFQIHLQDMTDADIAKIKQKLQNLSLSLNIDGNNIKVSNTDVIKKQIENAVKSVVLPSVKIDTNAVKQQIEASTQGVVPQIRISLLKDNLASDIQSYLNTKSFDVKISILKTDIAGALKNIGSIAVPVSLKVDKKVALEGLKKSLLNMSVPVGVRMKSSKDLVKDIQERMKSASVKVGIDVNKNVLRSNVTQALKGQIFKANLDLVVQKASVQQAIRAAFAQAGLKYNTTVSDARQNLIDTRTMKASAYADAQKALADLRRAQLASSQAANQQGNSMQRVTEVAERQKGVFATLRENVANAYAVYRVGRFLNTAMRIGGEFQQQHIALQTIIGDADKASALFERIKNLAVESPFKMLDLSKYTKQLAAFSIPYEELYDTLKRFGDLSAGLGVDMGRIILAYGQVRSAEFLKGTELRQFTEAGIPLVTELAKKYTELRGTLVSVGDVYDMISKKQVSFADVKDVLWDLTSEGGKFFNMQAALTDTLKGKLDKLADSYEIFLSEIANSNNDVLGGTLDLLADTLKHWELIQDVVIGVSVAYGSYKAAVLLVAAAEKTRLAINTAQYVVNLSRAMQGLTAVTKAQAVAQAVLNAVTSANPFILAATVIGSLVGLFITFRSETESEADAMARLSSEMQEAKDNMAQQEREASKLVSVMSNEKRSIEERNAAYDQLREMYGLLFPNMTREQVLMLDELKIRNRVSDKIREQYKEQLKLNMAKAQENLNTAQSNYDKKIQQWEEDPKNKIRGRNMDTPAINAAKAELEKQKNIFAEAKKYYDEILEAKKYYDEILEAEKVADETRKERWYVESSKIANAANQISLAPSKDELDRWNYFDRVKQTIDDIKNKIKSLEPKSSSYSELFPSLDAELNAAENIYYNVLGGKNEEVLKAAEEARKQRKDQAKKDEKEREEAAKRLVQAYADALKDEIAKVGSQWNLFKDLLEATGNESVSMNLAFGGQISFKSQLEQLEKMIDDEIKKNNLGISVSDLLNMSEGDIASKINSGSWGEDMVKNLTSLTDAYKTENEKVKEESIRNFIEIVKNSNDFAQQIENIERKLQKDLNDLRANAAKGGLSKTDLERRETELTARAEEEKSKVRFEEFKKSSDWVKVFDDLDRVSDATLDNMISKIEEFARQAGISEEVTKQLVEAMGKLRDENIERNPLQGFKDAWGRMRDIKDAFKRGQMDDGLFYLKQSNGTYKGLTEKELNDEQADANEDLKDSALAVADKFQAVANAANLLSGLFENLGIDLSGISDIFGGAASGAMTGAGLASAFGASGPWGAIAGAAVGMLSSVFAMHDKALQKEIEASEEREKAIKNMSDNLEGLLERTMGSIYTISLDKGSIDMLNEFLNRGNYWKDTDILLGGNYYSEQTRKKAQEALREDSYYDAQLAALMAQRDEIQKQMQLEDEKKKTDKGKMEDYEKEIRELGVAIDEFAKDFADALYGINFKDWANQLTEAVVDAWSKGEDAAAAYANKVTELLRQVGVSAISQQFLQPLIEEQTKGFIQQFEKDNGKLTEFSMQYLANIYNGAEKAVEYTEAYLEGLKKMGIDLSESSKDASSGLYKGTQSVTEDTANLLGSYLNSIRHDSSVQRNLIEQLVSVDVPQMSIIAQAQLQQLQQVAANTKRNADAADRIYELVNKVVDKGSNKLKI